MLFDGDQVDAFFAERDASGTGRVTFPDFVAAYTAIASPSPAPMLSSTRTLSAEQPPASRGNGAVHESRQQSLTAESYLALVRQVRLAERNREFVLAGGHSKTWHTGAVGYSQLPASSSGPGPQSPGAL